MKKPTTIVSKYLKNKDLSKLHFVEVGWFYEDEPDEDQENVEYEIKHLKGLTSIRDRVHMIVELAQDFATFDSHNKFQCRKEANRSTVDIWRLYNNYFRPVGIFTIMRALYELVVDENIETLFCPDIRKQVFCPGSGTEMENIVCDNELGVRVAEWRTIGLRGE